MEKGSISIYFVRSALEPIIERGLAATALLRHAGISPALVQSPQGRVTAQHFSALWLAWPASSTTNCSARIRVA